MDLPTYSDVDKDKWTLTHNEVLKKKKSMNRNSKKKFATILIADET